MPPKKGEKSIAHNKQAAENYKLSAQEINSFRGALLDWYDTHRRTLPWRAPPFVMADPYFVWMSEIMLQQTVVAAVIPYFLDFTKRWPSVFDLAAADSDEVMCAWAGLGYYARARNLLKCANVVAKDYNGVFPQELAALKQLPGVGDYTAAAIRAIAFNKPATVVDGNVERVVARYFAVEEPLPDSKKELKARAAALSEEREDRPGDFAQAMMDLGATICTPKSPKCILCPLQKGCAGRKQGIAEALPRKKPKAKKPEKFGYIYWIENEEGELLLQKRPESGMLGHMTGFPCSIWRLDGFPESDELYDGWQLDQKVEPLEHIRVYHSFTHFNITLEGRRAFVSGLQAKALGQTEGFFWEKIDRISPSDMPTLFSKFLRLADKMK